MRMASSMQLQNAARLVLGLVMVAVLCLAVVKRAAAAAPLDAGSTALDRGFLGLYNLDFSGAQKDFSYGNSSIRMIRWGR